MEQSDIFYVLRTFETEHTQLTKNDVITLFERASILLGNLAHYYHGRPHEAHDVMKTMKALFDERN